MKTIIYQGSCPFIYYLVNGISGEPYKVSEEEFFKVVGYKRSVVPMHYDKDNINRQNFFLDGNLIGYRVRQIEEN